MAKRRDIGDDNKLNDLKVSIAGLDHVGRLVAEQLAALGVGRLILVDSAVITRRRQQLDGYSAEMIGQRRTAAAAQRCHEINPGLDITLHARPTHRSWSGSNVVVCSPGESRRMLRERPADWNGLIATWVVRGRFASVITAADRRALRKLIRNFSNPNRAGSQPPVPVATVLAGLLVHVIAKEKNANASDQRLRVDLRTRAVTVGS